MQQSKEQQKKQPNRGGRPPKAPEDRKTVQLKVWVTEAEAAAIKQKVKAEGFKHTGQFLSRAIRDAVNGTRPVIQLNPVDMRNLAGVGNNLNQIAKHLNQRGEYYKEMHEDVIYVRELIKKLGNDLYQALGKNKKKGASK